MRFVTVASDSDGESVVHMVQLLARLSRGAATCGADPVTIQI